MSIFNQLKQSLISQLSECKADNGLCKVAVSVENADLDLLGWLKGQSQFPQLFWQHRKGNECFAALGQSFGFHDLIAAEQFSQNHQVHLVGGIRFDGKVQFFLPRLLLWQQDKTLTAEVFSLENEREELILWLKNLSDGTEFQSVENTLVQRRQGCSFNIWQSNIQQAISHIQAGNFDKVVLANATEMQFAEPLSAHDLLAQSRAKNLGCYHFLFAEQADVAFIGSSPERLYSRQNQQFFTEALAGTVAVSDDEQETAENALWLLNDHKNLYENWLVVDDICNHLSDCCYDIQVGEAHIKQLKNVQHLRRFLQTELAENVSDAACLARIHPTAAVAGLPRASAKAFIQQHEPFKRQWYAGTLGYLSPNKAEFCVTLRSALIQQNQMTVYAGAGIVAESDPESEWQEIERKALAMCGLISDKR